MIATPQRPLFESFTAWQLAEAVLPLGIDLRNTFPPFLLAVNRSRICHTHQRRLRRILDGWFSTTRQEQRQQ